MAKLLFHAWIPLTLEALQPEYLCCFAEERYRPILNLTQDRKVLS